jgi:hypothetical protein
MENTSSKTWALVGAAGGAGFGLFAAPLIFILVNLFFGGVTFGQTVGFALASGFTWGVFGGIAAYYLWFVNSARTPPSSADLAGRASPRRRWGLGRDNLLFGQRRNRATGRGRAWALRRSMNAGANDLPAARSPDQLRTIPTIS